MRAMVHVYFDDEDRPPERLALFRFPDGSVGFAMGPDPPDPRSGPTAVLVPQHGQVTVSIDDLPNILGSLHNYGVDKWCRVHDAFPELPTTDPRLMIVQHIRAVISATFLNSVHLVQNLTRPEFWKEVYGETQREVAEGEMEYYLATMSETLMVFSFSAFEANIRRLHKGLRALGDPPTPRSFNGIYALVLDRLSNSGWHHAQADTVVRMLRLVRNSLHNNGHFLPESGRNERVVWREREFNFIYGERIQFLDWPTQAGLVADLLDVAVSIACSSMIAALPPMDFGD